MSMKQKGESPVGIKRLILILLPTAFSWILLSSFFLIYSFDMILYVKSNNLIPLMSPISAFNDFILMAIWGIPTGITLCFTGMTIDKYPKYLGKFVSLSIFGCSIFLAIGIIALKMSNGFLVAIALACLGFFMGIQIISGHTLFGSQIKWSQRGKAYSLALFAFLSTSLVLLMICQIFSIDFFFPLAVIAIFGFGCCILLFFSTKSWFFWENDPWPTKSLSIITRYSNIGYFWTHCLIWLMFGLIIGSLSQAGSSATVVSNSLLGIDLDVYKDFWAIVIIGSMLLILPSGFLTDKLGRKTPIILATYGLVFASVIVGLLEPTPTVFFISAILVGFSFSLVHPSLDSSLWIDLTPMDSIGRYSSLGFASLGLGLVIGFFISYWIFLQTEIALIINAFMLIGLSVLASLPLFWISDSFPPLDFFLLLVINDAGMPIFHYKFGEKKFKVDLELISSALSAVSTFMLEATKEENAVLNLVRHGTYYIMSEGSDTGLSAAVFANKNDPELQKLVKKFLNRFEEKFRTEIPSWTGRIDTFSDAVNDAEEIFGPICSIKK